MKRMSSTAALAAFLALAPAAAFAAAGNGIRLGGSDGRLHPFLELEGRYDSNVYYAADRAAAADVIIHVRPGVELTVPGERIAVDFSGNLDWAQYLGQDDPDTSDLSELYGEAGLGLTLNRRGTVSLELDDDFRRSPSTSALAFGTAVVSNLNALRVRVPWKPGGGALVLAATGGWTLETFEPYFDQPICDPVVTPTCDPDVLSDLGYDEFRAGGEARWRFLPRTSAVLEGGWYARQPNDEALSDEVSGFDAMVGLTGLLTPHLGGTVKLGYGATSGAEEDVGGLLAIVEAEWTPTQAASLRVGYGRAQGVDPGTTLSVYAADRVNVVGRILFGGRYSARLDARWEHRAYEIADGSATADLFTVTPSLEVAVSRWMNVSLGYGYTDRDSSFPEAIPAAPAFSYSKSEAWLRLAFRY
jgi:hypothetical protein